MKRDVLTKKVAQRKAEINAAEQAKIDIEVIFSALNNGQRKQLVKDAAVQEIFTRYGIEV